MADRHPPEVVHAPASLDATLALVPAAGPRLIVLVDPSRPQLAALSVAIAHSTTTRALAGHAEDVARCLADVADHLAAGRLVHAHEWLADRDAARLGRAGLAGLPEPTADDRPRTLAESPLPPAPQVRDALLVAARSVDLRRYPPVVPSRLQAALARRHAVPETSVVVSGGGSLELIERVLRTFTSPGDLVVSHAPAFHGLLAACLREDRTLRLVTERAGGDRLDALLAALPGARLACVASPNTLDSQRFSAPTIEHLRRELGPGRLLLLDEAYAGLTPELDLPELPDAPDLAPVIRLRTFSKLEGLAGLRLGYALAPPPVAALLRRLAHPYALTLLHEDTALAALADRGRAAIVGSLVERVRAQLVDGLTALGFVVPPSTTHLLLATPPEERFAFWCDVVEALSLPMEPCPEIDGTFQLSVPDDDTARHLLEALRVASHTPEVS